MRHAWILALALAVGCDDAIASDDALTTSEPPERTAAQNDALRAMVIDVAEAQACPSLVDHFLPLPEDREQGFGPGELPIVEGRLWVSECRVERRDGALGMHVEGRGWQWIQRSAAGPFATEFMVRGHVRFEASAQLDADVDLGYDTEARRARVVLTPRGEPIASLRPIGTLPVTSGGGWSGIIGGLGSLLGADVQSGARPIVEEQGAAMMRRLLGGGATFTLDLCRGQLDGSLGAIGDGQAPPPRPYDDGEPWIDNMRVRLRPGGLDMSGPWEFDGARLLFDVDIEEGSGAEVVVVCAREASVIASEFLGGGGAQIESPLAHQQVRRGHPLELAVDEGHCEAPVLVVMPSTNESILYRYRVRREGATTQALANCDSE